MAEVLLNKGKGNRNREGHPWVYDNEIASVNGAVKPGDIVSVIDSGKNLIGKGYYNPQSKLTVRLLTNLDEKIDAEFFHRKIKNCIDYRKKFGYTENYRVVFGEGDFLPGLVIDKFGDVIVIQTLSLGMDKWKPEIVAAINDLLKPKGIYERNDIPVRKLEGLEEYKGFLSDPFDTTFVMNEAGVKFNVDVVEGQKTGFFLDQKENKLAMKNIVKDASVLDCFCYTGSFSLQAAQFGARQITAIDVSESAIAQADANARLNGFENNCDFKAANAFDVLPQWVREKKLFDVVILDPPAFTKNRAGTASAARGYKEVNLRAMQLVRSGGFLLTFSCSHFMTPDLFFDAVYSAAIDSGKKIRQVEVLAQAKDHPVIWQIPETNYLKGFLLQVI